VIQYNIVPISFLGRIFTVELRPVNRPDLEFLERKIEIPEEVFITFEENTFDEQLTALRKIIVDGNGGYQADWEAQLITSRIENLVAPNYQTVIGKEFFAVTEEEVAAPVSTALNVNEVIF